jgi:cytochrome c oxidase assembly protein subunit 15
MTRIHAEIVIATVLVLLALLWVLWRTDAPARVQDAGRILLAVMVVQGIVGYTQFFTHLPAVLVGIHVFGATMVWSTALWFHHGLSDHRPEVDPDGHPVLDDGSDRSVASGSDGDRVAGTLAVPPSDRDAAREPV